MVNLGDYLGQLLAEISMARVQADLEAVRIAEMYASHELLKHFPIPRIRLDETELELPIVIVEVKEIDPHGTGRGGLSAAALAKLYQPILSRELAGVGIPLTDDETKKITQVVDEAASAQARPGAVEVDSMPVIGAMSKAAQAFLVAAGKDADAVRKAIPLVNRLALTQSIEDRTGLPRVAVGVTSSEIREAAPESVIRIGLKISEEGLAWTQIRRDDGGDESRLTLE